MQAFAFRAMDGQITFFEGFLQRINLVTLPLNEAVIGSHLCSFTLDGEKHLGIAASRIIPWVKLHWRVESALYFV
jgi:hypothetical protein